MKMKSGAHSRDLNRPRSEALNCYRLPLIYLFLDLMTWVQRKHAGNLSLASPPSRTLLSTLLK